LVNKETCFNLNIGKHARSNAVVCIIYEEARIRKGLLMQLNTCGTFQSQLGQPAPVGNSVDLFEGQDQQEMTLSPVASWGLSKCTAK
jgi:hypothetical protein